MRGREENHSSVQHVNINFLKYFLLKLIIVTLRILIEK